MATQRTNTLDPTATTLEHVEVGDTIVHYAPDDPDNLCYLRIEGDAYTASDGYLVIPVLEIGGGPHGTDRQTVVTTSSIGLTCTRREGTWEAIATKVSP